MWTLYIEVAALILIIVFSLAILFIYIVNNTYSMITCSFDKIDIVNVGERLIITSSPEDIAVLIYTICVYSINGSYVLNYTTTTSITPTYLPLPSRNCIYVVLSSSNYNLTSVYTGTQSGTLRYTTLYISMCGIQYTSPGSDCQPWILINITYDENGYITNVQVLDKSVMFTKYCEGIPILYEWLGGLIKEVAR